MSTSTTAVVPYDPTWVDLFSQLGTRLRRELGPTALRIDHIGSTSVPGLDAKPVIDVQISVSSLDPVDAYRGSLERCGFAWRTENTELTKRYFPRAARLSAYPHPRAAGGQLLRAVRAALS
jgi:GrpB-like predicted nucleotidyltransferase (UPF0157 family)